MDEEEVLNKSIQIKNGAGRVRYFTYQDLIKFIEIYDEDFLDYLVEAATTKEQQKKEIDKFVEEYLK